MRIDKARGGDGLLIVGVVEREDLQRPGRVILLHIGARRRERDERLDAARSGDGLLVVGVGREVGQRPGRVLLLRIGARRRERDERLDVLLVLVWLLFAVAIIAGANGFGFDREAQKAREFCLVTVAIIVLITAVARATLLLEYTPPPDNAFSGFGAAMWLFEGVAKDSWMAWVALIATWIALAVFAILGCASTDQERYNGPWIGSVFCFFAVILLTAVSHSAMPSIDGGLKHPGGAKPHFGK